MTQTTATIKPLFPPYFPNLQRFLQWPRTSFLQPFTAKSEPFTQWNAQPYQFVTNDFCHDKTFVAKIKAKTSRSLVKIKQTVTQKANAGPVLSDEVKLWFDLPNHGVFYTKVKSSDYIKVMYDHGLRYYQGRYLYVFGGINTTKLLNHVDARLGVGFVGDNYVCQNRIKAVLSKHTQFYWYHKSFVARNDLRFGVMTVANLNTLVLQKNNLLLGYYFRPDTCGYLRVQVNGFRNNNPDIRRPVSYFDSVTADLIHRINNNSKAALQATLSISQKRLQQAKLVYQYQHSNNRSIKASISNKLNLALVAKTPLYGLEETGTLSVGLGVEQLSSNDVRFKTGFEVNLNL